ncbi:hypothetical protein LINPERHAP2_LOCUS33134 [Linum perenne]
MFSSLCILVTSLTMNEPLLEVRGSIAVSRIENCIGRLFA